MADEVNNQDEPREVDNQAEPREEAPPLVDEYGEPLTEEHEHVRKRPLYRRPGFLIAAALALLLILFFGGRYWLYARSRPRNAVARPKPQRELAPRKRMRNRRARNSPPPKPKVHAQTRTCRATNHCSIEMKFLGSVWIRQSPRPKQRRRRSRPRANG